MGAAPGRRAAPSSPAPRTISATTRPPSSVRCCSPCSRQPDSRPEWSPTTSIAGTCRIPARSASRPERATLGGGPHGPPPKTLGRTGPDLYRGGVLNGPRLRQVALVAHDCDRVAGELRQAFGLAEPFHDPGVGQFGLTNAVFAVGDTFLEVVAPARPDTTAGRYLERRGGDGGYMAIFQMPDLAAARRRLADLGVRVV